MSVIQYSLICEDDVQKSFIENLLSHTRFSSITFQFNSKFYYQLKCRGKAEVLRKMKQAANWSFLYNEGYYCDILFVGIDYDDRDRSSFDNELKNLYDRIDGKAKEKTIIFFPVQAIEHWLLLLNYRKENSSVTKNISSQIESINRKEAKQRLYAKNDKNSIVTDVLSYADYDWLESNSQSFRALYNKLTAFLFKK